MSAGSACGRHDSTLRLQVEVIAAGGARATHALRPSFARQVELWHYRDMDKGGHSQRSGSDHQTATKADLLRLSHELKKEFATKTDVQRLKGEIDESLRQFKDEIIHEFKAAVENIEEALKGANADEISLLQDRKRDHEERITALERRSGIR